MDHSGNLHLTGYFFLNNYITRQHSSYFILCQ